MLIEQTIARVYDRANRTDSRLAKPLLLVIDEAAKIAPLPDLAQIASTARGVGIQLVTIWQDCSQIQAALRLSSRDRSGWETSHRLRVREDTLGGG